VLFMSISRGACPNTRLQDPKFGAESMWPRIPGQLETGFHKTATVSALRINGGQAIIQGRYLKLGTYLESKSVPAWIFSQSLRLQARSL
jgi:hypothetical protein